MQTYIVLLRGVNVGGKNLLPMKQLVTLLEEQNFKHVSYYIQSGNLIIESEIEPSAIITNVIVENFGFSPDVFVFNSLDFFTIIDKNPFKELEGKFVHFYFGNSRIEPNDEKIKKWISLTEEYHVDGNVFYFCAPDGVGRSKVVLNIETCIGQSGTGRNLNTVNKLKVLVEKL